MSTTLLNGKLGEMEFDGLVTGILPHLRVDGATITSTEAATLVRGTVLGTTTDGDPLSIMASGSSPRAILCDDTEVEAGAQVVASVFVSGCFDPQKVTVSDGYTLTDADKDELRIRNIEFKAASPGL